MRMTHHCVVPADIRWLLALLGPRMLQRAAPRWRELGLDDKTFGRFTFALLDERVPRTKPLARDASLAELARRYFTTRGPATLRDFMWWSGLTAADAKASVALAGTDLVAERIDGTAYCRGLDEVATRLPAQAFLLPMYDEYAVAYRDRSAIGSAPAKATSLGEATLLTSILVVAGEVVGTWSRTITAKSAVIRLSPWRMLAPRERQLVDAAADRYAAFLALPRA